MYNCMFRSLWKVTKGRAVAPPGIMFIIGVSTCNAPASPVSDMDTVGSLRPFFVATMCEGGGPSHSAKSAQPLSAKWAQLLIKLLPSGQNHFVPSAHTQLVPEWPQSLIGEGPQLLKCQMAKITSCRVAAIT